jgi:hypothetical protein
VTVGWISDAVTSSLRLLPRTVTSQRLSQSTNVSTVNASGVGPLARTRSCPRRCHRLGRFRCRRELNRSGRARTLATTSARPRPRGRWAEGGWVSVPRGQLYEAGQPFYGCSMSSPSSQFAKTRVNSLVLLVERRLPAKLLQEGRKIKSNVIVDLGDHQDALSVLDGVDKVR